MAAKLKVTYEDGTEVEVSATPRAQVMTERFLRAQGGFAEATVVEASFRLAYESIASRKLLKKDEAGNDHGYDEWLNTITDVEELEEIPPADPTPGAQSPTSSSD